MKEHSRIHVLFVCLGNICRSPTAEAVFQNLLAKKNLTEQVYCESAGTANYHIGERPDSRTIQHGEKRGYQFLTRAQHFDPAIHFEKFDWIICMDESNKQNILRLDQDKKYHHKVKRLLEFVSNSNLRDVPDPYHGTAKDFEVVLDIIEVATPLLLNQII